MHSNLKTFNTIKFYKSWTIFWRFLLIFSFFEFKFKFENPMGIYRAVLLPHRGGINGYRGNRNGYQR
jgi:hypothetical protein